MPTRPEKLAFASTRAALARSLSQIDAILPGSVVVRQMRCGKANCTRCPHGPYWYAYWREDGRLRSRYLGSARAGRSPGDDPPAADASAGR